MDKKNIYLGKNVVITDKPGVSGQFVEIDNEKYYQISNYNEMDDFFISIVSDSNHWMFISSNGSLSAGRKDRDNALFPYYTVDKIHDYRGITGSSTYFLVEKNSITSLWEPNSKDVQKYYSITRNLYKSIYGNNIVFEEINNDLGLCFRYGWYNSEKYGFVKKSSLTNITNSEIKIEIFDGIRNIMPGGADYNFQNEYSNLLDAYKKSELAKGTTLGMFMLSSIPVDKAEPSEALTSTTVWSAGFNNNCTTLISDKQVNSFIAGNKVVPEYDIRASRGAYFVNTKVNLTGKHEWITVAEINQSSTDVANLIHLLKNTPNPEILVNNNIRQGTLNLMKKVGMADGFQKTGTELCYARHFSNTMFNIMRGGVFAQNYLVEKTDFSLYLWQINRMVTKENQSWLDNLPDEILYSELLQIAINTNDADLVRIAYEYLPLTFSRRHGDPSRPWNMFSIETKNQDGSIKYYYAGNWRDIFQNWEALCFSYPEFTEGIIAKFVNATTIDGYNPYRIMRDGIDWESPDPDDPWAYIGYWGDHQIIYLQKLLELSENFHPGKIDSLLTNNIFTYANVPYEIKDYSEIYQNPKDTVLFNRELDSTIKAEREHLGADASLHKNQSNNQIYKVNLTEKLLVTLLSKISNFIPEAGIWLNTQRPEWNDANNALVGNGTSMVTLYYLRRFLNFWNNKLSTFSEDNISISDEVATLFKNIYHFLEQNVSLTEKGFTNTDRKKFADALGQAHWKYRNEIYQHSFSGIKTNISTKKITDFTAICIKYIDQSIIANKRADGLYHSYNLVSLNKESISVRHLYEMLEGQVAVLSSGFLSSHECLNVLDALKSSKIYREDQFSYMLYPDRQLPRFLEKNNIPKKQVDESTLLQKLVNDNETSIIEQDIEGNYHFNGSFRNANILLEALNNLRAEGYSHLVEKEKDKILNIYENIFDHQSFTGRSGTFYGYEGLGSIYWHMVSKLLLATQECFFRAIENGASSTIIGQLKEHYYEIKAGIGLYKSPDIYGGFPTDAYSHTPANAGVKQPGLTGQVKEDFISRIGEIGVRINNGIISFDTKLLNNEEILENSQDFEYFNLNGDLEKITLQKNQIAFTFCQIPVIYTFSSTEHIDITFKNGSTETITGLSLNDKLSSSVFHRSGEIFMINVTVKRLKYDI